MIKNLHQTAGIFVITWVLGLDCRNIMVLQIINFGLIGLWVLIKVIKK
ncbi:MAG: hypothetical protein GX050_10200 [Firmicutes bacterium]|nr:hypothetical protein [Bacillota bacterium]